MLSKSKKGAHAQSASASASKSKQNISGFVFFLCWLWVTMAMAKLPVHFQLAYACLLMLSRLLRRLVSVSVIVRWGCYRGGGLGLGLGTRKRYRKRTSQPYASWLAHDDTHQKPAPVFHRTPGGTSRQSTISANFHPPFFCDPPSGSSPLAMPLSRSLSAICCTPRSEK